MRVAPEIEAVVSRFKYDAASGVVSKVTEGGELSELKTVDRHGYVRSSVGRRYFFAHRMAWRLHYGAWPAGQIDHINGNRQDNRIINLRIVGFSENAQNRHARLGSSPFKGVTLHKPTGKWQAQIKKNNRSHYLGLFSREVDAAAAYDAASKRLFGSFCNHNNIGAAP